MVSGRTTKMVSQVANLVLSAHIGLLNSKMHFHLDNQCLPPAFTINTQPHATRNRRQNDSI